MSNKTVNKRIKKSDLEKDIKMKNTIIINAKRQMRFAFVFIVICALLAFWSFSGYVDPLFPNVNTTVRSVAKVISVVGLILSVGFTAIYFNGIRRARKLLLEEINYFDKMK